MFYIINTRKKLTKRINYVNLSMSYENSLIHGNQIPLNAWFL